MDRSRHTSTPNPNHVKADDAVNEFILRLSIIQFYLFFFSLSFIFSFVYFEISLETSFSQLSSASEIGSHSNCSAGSLFDGAVDEATPSQGPVRASKYNVALSCSHILQMRG